jgi:dienelactone hydrolase
MAAILFLAGVLKGGLALPLASVGAVAGGVVAVIGLMSPGGKSAKKRAAMPTASPKTIFSMIFGGVWTILLIAKPFLREASRLERQGEAVTADAVFSGVLPTVMAFIVLGGGYLAVRRFGLFRVLAPLYLLVAGFGTLMALAVGPTAPGRVDLPPAGAIVAGESGPVVIADPLAPQSAAIGRVVLGGSRAVGDVIRSEYTLPTGAGGGGTPLKFVVYRKVFVNWSQEVATWPCVILAPAGSNLLAGRDLGDGDHPEALPWANAGYVVIQVALPGAIADPERVTGGEVKRTFAEFSAARAGLGCVEQVLAYIKQEMPQVDPRRIAAVGHSSAGTLALLAAESNPEIKACVAFAPCTDVTEFHRDNFAVLETVIPTVRKFCSDYSPINHVDRLQCPIFFFQADDDSVTPVAGAVRFVDAAKEQQKLIEFVRVPIGDHYQSMIDEGIPRAIQWLDATFARAIAPRPSAAPRPAALQ